MEELEKRRKILEDLDEIYIEMKTDELERFWAWMIENQYSENLPWNQY